MPRSAKFRIGAFLLSAVLGIYLVSLGRLYFNQGSYIYHPETQWIFTPKEIGLDFEEITFRAADGVELSGWFVPAKADRATILFCHGNTGNISYERIPIKDFNDLGLSAFFFDYRGYGHSRGKITEAGVALDADAAWAYLTEVKKILPDKIIICGRSFGATVAIPLAARKNPRALMVEAAFTSLSDIAAVLHPNFPVKFFLNGHYDSISILPKVHCPVFVVHSREDQLIPFAHGRRLFEAAPNPKTFVEITGPHNNKNDPASQALYQKGVADFINNLLA